MKNIIKSAGFALAAMVMGFAVSAQAGTFNIVFDTFCDGVSATFDANGDGYLSADEYWSAEAWTRVDRNHNGRIDADEWVWWPM